MVTKLVKVKAAEYGWRSAQEEVVHGANATLNK